MCPTAARLAGLDEPAPSSRAILEAQKLRNDVAAAEAIKALDREGIPSILIKGPAIAGWLYDEGENRPYGDVDLLVAPVDFARAEGVLAGLGFERLELQSTRPGQTGHHENLCRELDGVCIELHRSFLGIGVPDTEFWTAMDKRTRTLQLEVYDVVARIPDVEAGALLVGLHAAAHSAGGKPVEDLRRALDRLSEQEWKDAVGLARRLRAEGAFAAGLACSADGRSLVDRLGLLSDAGADVLLRAGSMPPTAMGWETLSRTPGLVPKLKYLFRELVPPADYLRLTHLGARRSNRGLAVAYLVRPFSLALASPRGFRAWRRARKHADR